MNDEGLWGIALAIVVCASVWHSNEAASREHELVLNNCAIEQPKGKEL